MSMKGIVQKRLLEDREIFRRLDNYQDIDFYNTLLIVRPNEENNNILYIYLSSQAVKNCYELNQSNYDENIVKFNDDYTLGSFDELFEEFKAFILYAQKKYAGQMHILTPPLLQEFYGRIFSDEEMLYILDQEAEIPYIIKYLGFCIEIRETIF